MMKNITKLTTKLDTLAAKMDKLGVSAKADQKQDTWTCAHCKAEKCFAARAKCYKCGEPRVPTPPGLGAKAAAEKSATKQVAAAVEKSAAKQVAAAAQPMEDEDAEEETVEDRISEVEENLKILKGKESAWAKAQKADLEAQLKALKEQQKLARPLPARLQAATDRVATTGQAVKEGEAEVAAICESLKVARKKLDESQEKHQAALQELEAVKKVAGAEPVGEAERGLAAGMRAALAARSIVGSDAEALLAEVIQYYLSNKEASTTGSQPVPPGQGKGVSSQPATPTPVPQPWRTVRGGRGRSLPRDQPVPRSTSVSRSPRNGRDDDY